MTEVSPSSSSLPQARQHQSASLPCSYITGKENGGEDVSTNVHTGEKTSTKSTDKAATSGSILQAAAAAVPPSPPSIHQNDPPPPPPQQQQQQQQQQGPSPVVLTDMSEQHNDNSNSNDNTAFTTTSTTVEEHLERLRHDFSDLLLDTAGDQRMAFLPCPESVTSLLSEAWNKGTGAVPTATTKKDASRKRHVVDRVDRKLKPVQTFFPNLLNYLLTSPGFPTSASGAGDGAIFQPFSYAGSSTFKNNNHDGSDSSSNNRVQEAQDILTAMLLQQLVELKHADYSQRIIFYLSFLKSKEYMLQDAHIDFPYPTVNPFQKEEDEEEVNYREDDEDEEDNEQQQQEMSNNNNKRKTTSRRVTISSSTSSSTRSSRSRGRTATRRNSTIGQKRLKRQPYKKRVPFIALFPLTEAGMKIEIWKARGPDHKPSTTTATTTTTGDNNTMTAAAPAASEEQQQSGDDCGRIVHLPFGTMALMRGDILHAGGFINNEKSGDPRAHLYVYREDGELHDLNIKNSYDLPSTKLTQWAAAAAAPAQQAAPPPPTTTTNTEADGPGNAAATAAAAATGPTMMIQSAFPSMMKTKHRNKNIVPFSHLYRHHPERILREQQRTSATALTSKET